MGFKPVIFAFVVAFLAGTASSPIRVFVTGIVVALIEQYSSIWLSVRWTQTAVFVVLVVYLSCLSLEDQRSMRAAAVQLAPDLGGRIDAALAQLPRPDPDLRRASRSR